MKPFIACLLLAATNAAGAATPPDIDPGRITVSGLSAGGQMAHQLHIAYPDLFSGAAIIAGGPYGCAAGSVATAFARCMGSTGDGLPADAFQADIRDAAADGRIGEPRLLADDPVWLFHGTLDTTVSAGVSDALAELYAVFVPEQQIRYVDDVPAAHHFPAAGRGHACDASQPPFVGDCGYDAAGELLQHLYGKLRKPDGPLTGQLRNVALPDSNAAGLDDSAWLFVPDRCSRPGGNCGLHLVLHGCAQSAAQVGTTFIEQSGYLEWADENDIVLAFPQVRPGPENPFACWDWWGYTTADYLTRDAPQMRLLASWLQSLSRDETD